MKKSFNFAVMLIILMIAIFSNISYAASDNPGKLCVVQYIGDQHLTVTPISAPAKSITISADDYYQLLLMKEKQAEKEHQADIAYEAKVQQALYYLDHHECEDITVFVMILCIIGILACIGLTIAGLRVVINN